MGMIFLNGKEYTSSPKDGFPPIIYSDEEREIGVWRNGKPLYQKTYSLNSPDTTSSVIIQDITALNLDSLVNISGTINLVPLDWIYDSSTFCSCWVNDAKTGIAMKVSTNSLKNLPCKITLQYTKTTDTAGSGKYTTYGGIAHHYSTSEQVIGIWIDGKPLYEKTYLVTSPSSTSTENLVNLASLSVKHMIRIDATIFQTNNDATDSTNFFKVWYSSNNGNIRCLIMESAYCNMDMAVTIQYTKTTD